MERLHHHRAGCRYRTELSGCHIIVRFLSNTVSPNLLPIGEAPSSTVLPLKADIKGSTSELVTPSGAKITVMGLVETFAMRFASSSWRIVVLKISSVFSIG